MEQLKEIARYCASQIEDWDIKIDLALRMIGRRMPADAGFRSQIEDCIAEWCDDNEVSVDFSEWEDIVDEIIFTEI